MKPQITQVLRTNSKWSKHFFSLSLSVSPIAVSFHYYCLFLLIIIHITFYLCLLFYLYLHCSIFYFVYGIATFYFIFLLFFKYSYIHFPSTTFPRPTHPYLPSSILSPSGFVHGSFIPVPWQPFPLFSLWNSFLRMQRICHKYMLNWLHNIMYIMYVTKWTKLKRKRIYIQNT